MLYVMSSSLKHSLGLYMHSIVSLSMTNKEVKSVVCNVQKMNQFTPHIILQCCAIMIFYTIDYCNNFITIDSISR